MPWRAFAMEATRTIPIVMLDGPDPVAMGLVASLARPGGNLTGSTTFVAEATASALKIGLRTFGVRSRDDLPAVFDAVTAARVDAAVIQDAPLLNSSAEVVAALAATKRLPSPGHARFADAGGLLAYGSNRAAVYGGAAHFVERILKGANPAELPIQRATQFDLVVNLQAARALRLEVPQVMRLRATRVIE